MASGSPCLLSMERGIIEESAQTCQFPTFTSLAQAIRGLHSDSIIAVLSQKESEPHYGKTSRITATVAADSTAHYSRGRRAAVGETNDGLRADQERWTSNRDRREFYAGR